MKLSTKLVTTVASFAIAGGVYAFQDEPEHAPDSKKATTAIVTDDKAGDEISVSYRTVKYSQAQIDKMKESEEVRKMWAQFMPGKVSAELSTDVDLVYKSANEYTLPKGKYTISFGMNAELKWEMYLFAGQRRAAKIALDTKDSAIEFTHLTMNLMAKGERDFGLAVGYGKWGAVIPFSTKAAAQ